MDYTFLSKEQVDEIAAQRIWAYEKEHCERTMLVKEMEFNKQDTTAEKTILENIEKMLGFLKGTEPAATITTAGQKKSSNS